MADDPEGGFCALNMNYPLNLSFKWSVPSSLKMTLSAKRVVLLDLALNVDTEPTSDEAPTVWYGRY